MSKYALGFAGLLLASLSGVAAAQGSSADQFVPSVIVADSVAQCASMTTAALNPDERGFLLRFGNRDSAQRVVSAVWDTTGQLRRYSDARGDLRGPPVPQAERGARTTIVIDFVKGTALLLNEAYGRSHGSAMTTAAAALAAPRLGPPRDLLARLHTQCGAPAP